MISLFMQQLESLPAMVAGVYSDDPATQLEATTQFRKLLSIGMVLLLYGTYSWICISSVLSNGFLNE